MTIEEECRLSYYQDITPLNEKHGVYLVKNIEDGKLYVKKTVYLYNRGIYQYLQSLSCSYFPKLYECVETDRGLILIEEFINGDTVGELLVKQGVFAPVTAVSILAALCDALGQLHHHRPPIIHRDIKPSNIMITNDGLVKIIDFNTAKYYDGSRAEDTVLLGTQDYAAPEQFGFAQSDARTDIYALGVLLNVMLTGSLPKERLADGVFGGIVGHCIRLSPEQRYADVSILKQQLLTAVNISAPPAGTNGFLPKKVWRRTVYKQYHKYLPPGLRSGKWSHMIGAAIGYAFLLWFAFSATFIGPDGQPLPEKEQVLDRIMVFVLLLTPVLFAADYAGLRRELPLQGHPSGVVRAAAGVVECVILVFALLLVVYLGMDLLL